MKTTSQHLERRKMPLPGVLLLALALVAGLWAVGYYRAEARVSRATARLIRLVEKSGEETPVALGLAANRFGKLLATNAVLELAEYGPVAHGRAEIVQVFVQVRDVLVKLEIPEPQLAVSAIRRGEVRAVADARYRLHIERAVPLEGTGRAELIWQKQSGGWQVRQARISGVEGPAMPGGWK